jgi:cytochrome c556
MRVSRVLMAAGLAVLVSVGSVAILSAQAKTDEDYDKLMKAVGAANGAMRGAAKEQNAAGVAAEAAKMVALFKDAQAFWTARNNAEAAEWSGAAMKQADALSKSTDINAAMGAMKELGGSCMTCHTKYREKTETGFAIKKS